MSQLIALINKFIHHLWTTESPCTNGNGHQEHVSSHSQGTFVDCLNLRETFHKISWFGSQWVF